MTGSWFPELHTLAHWAAGRLGTDYDMGAPAWVHPLMHLILVLAPSLLFVSILALLFHAARQALQRHERRGPRRQTPARIGGLERNLLRQILRNTRRQQVGLLLLSLSLMPPLYLSLEMPKQIVNNVLEPSADPAEVFGLTLSQMQMLGLFSAIYLVAIALNGLGKYSLNTCKGRVAERLLRRLRLLIYRQWRRRPPPHRQNDVVQVLGAEVEPIGGFAADLIALPVTQGGTLLTILLFMFLQDPILGAAALTVLPVQLVLLPYLQGIVNRLSRERIRAMRVLTRRLAGQLAPEQSALLNIRQTAASLRELERIRYRIHRIKFLAKVLNNFLTSLTPFLFYSLGGYFVIEERITLGALIAVLAAHKDFSAPLKELFRYYQQLEDTRIRYREVLGFLIEGRGALVEGATEPGRV
ncbi:ABC transporter ATP-binding protein [Ruegeria sp. WL0004]|uniref:ABC transporter ATP-binding protein n=1 Tax=Ruegeria marisflavi TaxID=2984152 RepID=A0ABT2WX84_9RHOB|nr:ABC transporter ATP-binding protein [Ruegeria sp. WL0004]MCU9840248.1 ABC transporter ATP-binding protein [Ruegeria sp. WL0004]